MAKTFSNKREAGFKEDRTVSKRIKNGLKNPSFYPKNSLKNDADDDELEVNISDKNETERLTAQFFASLELPSNKVVCNVELKEPENYSQGDKSQRDKSLEAEQELMYSSFRRAISESSYHLKNRAKSERSNRKDMSPSKPRDFPDGRPPPKNIDDYYRSSRDRRDPRSYVYPPIEENIPTRSLSADEPPRAEYPPRNLRYPRDEDIYRKDMSPSIPRNSRGLPDRRPTPKTIGDHYRSSRDPRDPRPNGYSPIEENRSSRDPRDPRSNGYSPIEENRSSRDPLDPRSNGYSPIEENRSSKDPRNPRSNGYSPIEENLPRNTRRSLSANESSRAEYPPKNSQYKDTYYPGEDHGDSHMAGNGSSFHNDEDIPSLSRDTLRLVNIPESARNSPLSRTERAPPRKRGPVSKEKQSPAPKGTNELTLKLKLKETGISAKVDVVATIVDDPNHICDHPIFAPFAGYDPSYPRFLTSDMKLISGITVSDALREVTSSGRERINTRFSEKLVISDIVFQSLNLKY